MSWFSKLFKNVIKNFSVVGAVTAAAAPDQFNAAFGGKPDTPAAAPVVEAPAAKAAEASITPQEAEDTSSKRLARLGRYFTSPLGVLGNASTGSQKVFS